MTDSARRISVVVDADAAPFQGEMAKAADAEKEFIKLVLQAADAAASASTRGVESNRALADSYASTTGSVRSQVAATINAEAAETKHALSVAKTEAAMARLRAQIEGTGAATKVQAAEMDSLTAQYKRLLIQQQAVGDEATATADKQVAASRRVTEANATQSKSFADSSSSLVGFGKKVALTATGIAGASVFMATKFEESTLKLHTQAGASEAQLGKLRQGILDMATSVGQTPLKLEKGMYHVVSSMNAVLPPTKRAGEELRILRVAAEGAAVGGTNMEETAYALSAAMTALHLRAGDAEKTMGNLNAIVGAGDMTMGDLLDSLKSGVIPTAQAFGTDLQSVGAALAVFGDAGVRGAEAGTKLRMMFALLGGPTKKSVEVLKAVGIQGGDMKAHFADMEKALAEAGVSTTKMSEDLRQPNGLFVALKDLKTHLEDSGLSATASAAVITRAFGGARTGVGVTTLIQNLDRLDAKYHQIGDSTNQFGSDFEATQKTLAFEAKEFGAELEVVGIKIGTKLIPEVKAGISDIKDIAHWFKEGSIEAKALEGVIVGGLGLAVTAFTANKLSKMVSGLKEAGALLNKVTGGGGSPSGGISGIRGPAGAGSAANPIAVTGEGGGGGKPIGGAGKASEETGGVGKLLGADHPFRTGGVIAAGISGMAAAGKPGVIQTPSNIANAFAHGADPSNLVSAGGKLLGITIPSISQLILPSVKDLHFDPDAEPGKTAKAILNGLPVPTMKPDKQQQKYETHPSGGLTQASPLGSHPGVDHGVTTENDANATKKLVEARERLTTATGHVSDAQVQLNSLNQIGQNGTKEYERVVKELREAEQQRSRAQKEVTSLSPASDAAMAKQKTALDIVRSAYDSLGPSLKRAMGSARQAVGSELTAIARQTGPPSLEATGRIVAAYAALSPKLKAELDTAGGTVQKGLEKITAETNTELKALGVAGHITGDVGGAVTSFLGGGKSAARGGLMQLGKPGEAGRDSIPMSVGATNIVAAPGEQVAVFTRHQQADIASKIPGGLPSVFSNKTPNYMASGGFVAAPGTNYSVGEEPQIAADLKRLGEYLHVTLEGISGYRTPGHSVEVGGFSDDPHTRGEASDTEGTQSIPESVLEKFGLTRPFPGAAEADHMQLLGSAIGKGISAHAAPGGVANAAAKVAAKIKAPKVSGSGAITKIAQAALNEATAGANQRLGMAGAVSEPTSGGVGATIAHVGDLQSLNHIFKPGVALSVPIVERVAEWAGLPGHLFAQIAHGESSYEPGETEPTERVGIGGVPVKGFGLWQMTTGVGNDALINRFGGTQQMLNPLVNAKAAKALWDESGDAAPGTHGFPWYGTKYVTAAEGYLSASTGVIATAAKKTAPKKKIPPKNAKHPSHKKTLKEQLAAALAPLQYIPDTENLPADFGARSKALEGLQSQASLFQSLESTGKQDTFILPGDMSYIGPMSKYANVQAGMTTAQALAINEAATIRNKKGAGSKPSVSNEEEAEALAYQAEYINWAAEQASHRKLTASDVAILAGVGNVVGWTPKAGMPLWEAEMDNAQVQVNQLGGEEASAKHGLSLVGLAIKERQERERLVQSVMEREDHRLTVTKDHIDGLTKGSLKHKIAEAQSKERYAERLHAAQESSSSIQDAIDHEKEAANPDKSLISHLEKQKHEVSAAAKQGKPAAGKVGRAQVSLMEHELKGQLPAIEDALSKLGGKRTGIGHNGEYGKLVGETKTLRKSGTTVFQSAIEKIQTSDMPTALLNIRSIQEAAQDSAVPIFIQGSHEPGEEGNKGVLEGLLKQQLQQAGEKAATTGAELKTLTNFIPQIPRYEKGGPVVSDGLIYAHKGEHVVPVGGSLAVNSSSPNVKVDNHFHGVSGELISLIDSRVTHPDNARLNSQQYAQRGNLLTARRR